MKATIDGIVVTITDVGEPFGYSEDGTAINDSLYPIIEFAKERKGPVDDKYLGSFRIYHLFRNEYCDWCICLGSSDADSILPADTRVKIADWVRTEFRRTASDSLFEDENTPEWVNYIATDEDGLTYGYCCLPDRVPLEDSQCYEWSAPECNCLYLGWFNPITSRTVLERKNK